MTTLEMILIKFLAQRCIQSNVDFKGSKEYQQVDLMKLTFMIMLYQRLVAIFAH